MKRLKLIHKHDHKKTSRLLTMLETLSLSYMTNIEKSVLRITPTTGHFTEYFTKKVLCFKSIKQRPGLFQGLDLFDGIDLVGDYEFHINNLMRDINILKNVGLWDPGVERLILEEDQKRKQTFELIKKLPPEDQIQVREKMYQEFFKEFNL